MSLRTIWMVLVCIFMHLFRTLRILILSLTGMGLGQMKNIGKVPNTALYVIEARREAPGMPRSYHLLTPASEDMTSNEPSLNL